MDHWEIVEWTPQGQESVYPGARGTDRWYRRDGDSTRANEFSGRGTCTRGPGLDNALDVCWKEITVGTVPNCVFLRSRVVSRPVRGRLTRARHGVVVTLLLLLLLSSSFLCNNNKPQPRKPPHNGRPFRARNLTPRPTCRDETNTSFAKALRAKPLKKCSHPVQCDRHAQPGASVDMKTGDEQVPTFRSDCPRVTECVQVWPAWAPYE